LTLRQGQALPLFSCNGGRELQSGAARPSLTNCAERQFDSLVNLNAG